ncbi:hypothetical protein H6G25_03420 [Dolichospermum sp. FACHB-1091]|uniref:hypothetical protein n=1 Tax=Dolichospermum sp. FACHB-1091 TaxID=2692798 RepID=UPI0016804219|nr:hypothetical protein [Dolichospermum sp. FACHB-1091]MBD2442268.1 hypothetical protein [Dolichospermum sp. FACHB-1091]
MRYSVVNLSDRCGTLSDSVAWRKPYQDFQDFRIYRMRYSVVNLSDRCGQLSDNLQDVIYHFKRSLSSIKH